MALSMFALGLSFYFGKLGIVALIFYAYLYSSVCNELGPCYMGSSIRNFSEFSQKRYVNRSCCQWLANLIVSWTFPMMNDNIALTTRFNHGFAYWIYAIMGVLSALFIWKLVPETKGKTLEEIEKIWKKKKT